MQHDMPLAAACMPLESLSTPVYNIDHNTFQCILARTIPVRVLSIAVTEVLALDFPASPAARMQASHGQQLLTASINLLL